MSILKIRNAVQTVGKLGNNCTLTMKQVIAADPDRIEYLKR